MAKKRIIANHNQLEDYLQSGEFGNPTKKVTFNFLTLDFDKVDTSNFDPLELQSFNMLRKWKEITDKKIMKFLESKEE